MASRSDGVLMVFQFIKNSQVGGRWCGQKPPTNKLLLHKLNNSLDSFEICWATVAFVAGCKRGSEDGEACQNENLLQGAFFHCKMILDMLRKVGFRKLSL